MISEKRGFSPAISRYAYDAKTEELDIEFADGRRYRYSGVPAEVYTKFRGTNHLGRSFHQHIRDRYSTQRLYGAWEGKEPT